MMKVFFRNCLLILPLLLALPLTGCLFRTKVVQQRTSTATLETATQQELIDRLNATARQIRSLNATVNIDTSVGGEKKGKVVEYQQISGYILVRGRQMLRMIGLMPVIRNKAFDMVSNGSEFKMWVPPKNKFYVGRNNVVPPGVTGLTALRPQLIFDSLLLNDINVKEDIAVLEPGVELVLDPKTRKQVEQPDYRLDVLHRTENGWHLARKVYFSRIDLRPSRQTIYDQNGAIVSENHFDDWKQHGDVWFPTVIKITRPQEEYAITIGIVKLALNTPLTDQQFTLEQPAGAQLIPISATGARSIR